MNSEPLLQGTNAQSGLYGIRSWAAVSDTKCSIHRITRTGTHLVILHGSSIRYIKINIQYDIVINDWKQEAYLKMINKIKS